MSGVIIPADEISAAAEIEGYMIGPWRTRVSGRWYCHAWPAGEPLHTTTVGSLIHKRVSTLIVDGERPDDSLRGEMIRAAVSRGLLKASLS